MQTNDVVVNLQEDNNIILNCTYHEDAKEDIAKRNIRWQKQIVETFKDIAMFSPPGGPLPFIVKEMQPFYINRTELIAPNTSLSAVLIIKDPICSDEGLYRCYIVYYSSGVEKAQNGVSVVEFNGKYFFLLVN